MKRRVLVVTAIEDEKEKVEKEKGKAVNKTMKKELDNIINKIK